MRQNAKARGPRKGAGIVAVCLLVGLMLAPELATAHKYVETPFYGTRPFLLDLHGGFVWEGRGLSTGARFGIPIVHNGFIPKLNNAVYINFGADFYYIHTPRTPGRGAGYRPGLGFPVSMCWEFYFSDRWSAFFGEIGVNVFLDPRLFDGHGLHAHAAHWLLLDVGGRLAFNDTVALVLRIGLPYVSFGVTFMF